MKRHEYVDFLGTRLLFLFGRVLRALLSFREKQLLTDYFMNIASLEHNQSVYQRHQKFLDDLGKRTEAHGSV
jgi:hypothetical protein